MPDKPAPSIHTDSNAAVNHEVEDQIAAIRAIRDLEKNRLLTSLRLLRSYFNNEQLQTPLLEYFNGNLSNLCIVGNGEEEELDVCWKTEFPAAANGVHESILRKISLACADHSVMDVLPSGTRSQTMCFQDFLQTPGATGQRMSIGMTPKTLRLPKKGEMLLSVRGSPLGVFNEKEENMEAIKEAEES